MNYRINGGRWNSQAWNGPAAASIVAGDAGIIFNQSSIFLNWTGVDEAIYYQVQVSLFPDFRTTFVNASVSSSQHTFTDSQTNNLKRYWRWRPSIAAGSSFIEPWSEVGSYWLNTGAAEEVEVPRHYWCLIDPDDVTDRYFFEIFPLYTIVPQNIYRFQDRNRLGDLLSEFLTVKNNITLMFQAGQYLSHSDLNELRRFNNTKRTFFLATMKDGERQRPMPHIWKVEFTQDPAFTMIAAGRPDLLRGTITLTEV